MNIPNPAQVASARTARLAAQGVKPTYTTSTPVPPRTREHLTVVEIETVHGRYWSAPMVDSAVEGYIAGRLAIDHNAEVSDVDHAAKCWCFK